jgi:hypothetical protein
MNRIEQIAAIHKTVEDLSDEGCDAQVRTGYSGRAMFGRTCYGITSRERNDKQVIELAARNGLRGARVDSMGLGVIVYWPSIDGEGK